MLSPENPGILLYPEKAWPSLIDELSDPLRSGFPADLRNGYLAAARDNYETRLTRRATIKIPPKFQQGAGLLREVIVTGQIDHLVIYAREIFDALAEKPLTEEDFAALSEAPRGRLDDIYLESHTSVPIEAIDRWNLLIERLAKTPELLHALHHRKFEELIAELLEREGLSVTLTPRSSDGGRDILAMAQTGLGNHLYLVECKHYAPTRPVGVQFVRSLYGIVADEDATVGLLVTTSRFTKPARQFHERHQYRLGLKDYPSLVSWIRSHTGRQL